MSVTLLCVTVFCFLPPVRPPIHLPTEIGAGESGSTEAPSPTTASTQTPTETWDHSVTVAPRRPISRVSVRGCTVVWSCTPGTASGPSPCRWVHVSRHGIACAESCRASRHRAHSRRTCSISAWHLVTSSCEASAVALREGGHFILIILFPRETASFDLDRTRLRQTRRSRPDSSATPGVNSIVRYAMRRTLCPDLQWHWGLPESRVPESPPRFRGRFPRTATTQRRVASAHDPMKGDAIHVSKEHPPRPSRAARLLAACPPACLGLRPELSARPARLLAKLAARRSR